jgi:hypothetical protein
MMKSIARIAIDEIDRENRDWGQVDHSHTKRRTSPVVVASRGRSRRNFPAKADVRAGDSPVSIEVVKYDDDDDDDGDFSEFYRV